MNSQSIDRHPRRGLAVLLAASLLVRIGFIAAAGKLGKTPPVDYREYVTTGARLLEYGTLTSPFISEGRLSEPSSLQPPLYAFTVAGAYRIFGVETVAATLGLQLLNALAMTLVVLLVFRIADSLAGRRAAWIASILTAFNPMLFAHAGSIWDTHLFTLGATFAVWWSVKLSTRRPAAWKLFAFGAYLGLLALLNPALTLCYPPLVLWPCAVNLSWRRTTALACLAVAGWLLAITPWTIRNYRQFGELVYVRGGLPFELWLGACPEAETNPAGMYYARFPLKNKEVRRHINEVGEAAFVREAGQMARAAIVSDPLRFARLTAQRAIDFWFGTTRTHAQPFSFPWWPTQHERLALAVFLSAETLLAIATLVFARNRRTAVWLFSLALIFSLVYCVTHVELRFRVPIEPVLAVMIGLISRPSTHRTGQRSV